jgi:hypothetical protein
MLKSGDTDMMAAQFDTYLRMLPNATRRTRFYWGHDGLIDSNDIKSLYISTELGKNFTKISTDLQELVDWKHIEATNKIYFRTIEDANKNGEFDKKDKIHYHFLNLKDSKVSEYFPF